MALQLCGKWATKWISCYRLLEKLLLVACDDRFNRVRNIGTIVAKIETFFLFGTYEKAFMFLNWKGAVLWEMK